jgi:hypothetical protein
MGRRPEDCDLIRLRCENPFCGLYYLSPPNDPGRLCPSCRESKQRRRLHFPSARQEPTAFVLKHRKVINRYDRPASNRL